MALNSVCDQSRLPYEVIVVDDVGQPEVESLVASRGNHLRIRYIHRTSGYHSASASRNLGAELAEGELLAFLDDDDLWTPEFVEDSMALLNDSNVDLVISPLTAMTNQELTPLPRIPTSLSAKDVVVKNPGFTGSNFMIRRHHFMSVGGFDEALPVSNDKDLLVRLLQADVKYAVTGRSLALYRLHIGAQLTDRTVLRAQGIKSYSMKHAALLTSRQRRQLAFESHVCMLRSSTRTLPRIFWAVRAGSAIEPTHLRDFVTRSVRDKVQGSPKRKTNGSMTDQQESQSMPKFLGTLQLGSSPGLFSAAS